MLFVRQIDDGEDGRLEIDLSALLISGVALAIGDVEVTALG